MSLHKANLHTKERFGSDAFKAAPVYSVHYTYVYIYNVHLFGDIKNEDPALIAPLTNQLFVFDPTKKLVAIF